jgi:hypothetical protein
MLEVTGAADGEIFKRDKMGRVRVTRARREALLDEFERGGTSGAQFAEYVGVKYSTFANWIQKRQRRQRASLGMANRSRSIKSTTRAPMRWLETVVEAEGSALSAGTSLRVHLPGGAYLEMTNAQQAGLVAMLLENLRRLGTQGC